MAAVTPFNGPANLLIQKVAPALAVGNAVVVKPSPPRPEVALRETAKLLAAHPLVAVVTACAISNATSGRGGDGLTTTALPTASAGATF